MNIEKFKYDDCFPLLEGLEACFAFKSQTSISFDIGKRGKTGRVFSKRGWLDVHHPVPTENGFDLIKAVVRVNLPKQNLETEQMKQVLRKVFEMLEIPLDEIYEAFFFTAENESYLFIEDPGIQYSRVLLGNRDSWSTPLQ